MCKDLLRFGPCTGVCRILSVKASSEKEKLGVIFSKG